MTPSGIETATFRFVAQHLNHCATAVPNQCIYRYINLLYYKHRNIQHVSANYCGHLSEVFFEGYIA